jgi:hypothetical protein
LKGVDADPFIDKLSIPVGADWRWYLNNRLSECDSFVAILDKKSLNREWVAAELRAAVESRKLTGAPEITILIDRDIDTAGAEALPFFQRVLTSSLTANSFEGPEILRFNTESLAALVWETQTRLFPMAVLPFWMNPLSMLIIGPLAFLGSIGSALGIVAGVLALLDLLMNLSLSTTIENSNYIEPAVLISAYCAGFTARSALAMCYEQEFVPAGFAIWVGSSAISWMLVLLLFTPQLVLMTVAWSVVSACAGWLTVGGSLRISAGRGVDRRALA